MGKIKVLLADSDKNFVETVCECLSNRNDVEVIGTCTDGQSVIPAVQELKPDIILLALALKGMDGFSILKSIQDACIPVSVIICSEFYNQICLRRAQMYGAAFYICKPVYYEALCNAIVECAKVSGCALINETEKTSAKRVIDNLVADFLMSIGISEDSEGFKYLCDAAVLANSHPEMMTSLTKQLYPELARINSSTAARVERDIRSAVCRAYKSGHLNIDGRRPTNREMILMLANMLPA